MLGEVIDMRMSWPLLGLLLLMLLAASAVFSLLVRRETVWKRWVGFSDWSKRNGATLSRGQATTLPKELAFLAPLRPRVRLLLKGADWSLVEILGDPPPQSGSRGGRWRILLRQIDGDWPPTGLRPVTHLASLVDQLSLTSFPSLGGAGRFVVFGSAATAAKALAQSSAEALLPPDVGLTLAQNVMMLDFSPRPFDTIEFGRMMALSEQLAQHLPRVAITVAGS